MMRPLFTWFPIVGAPAIWFAQTTLLWLVAAWTCPDIALARPVSMVISAVALALGFLACLAALASWRHPHAAGMPRMAGWTRPDYTAAAGLLVSAASLVGIAASAVPVFMLGVCQPMR